MTDLYRLEEGKAMEADLTKSVSQHTAVILRTSAALRATGLSRMREKLTALLKEAVGSENIDQNRFEQELIFYLEKTGHQ
ncbi:MAG: hypothetical protein MZV63_62700 [Marinilabiliales bacterium]|nr:hypothetical protein [Marinilabiliales bacterium]